MKLNALTLRTIILKINVHNMKSEETFSKYLNGKNFNFHT